MSIKLPSIGGGGRGGRMTGQTRPESGKTFQPGLIIVRYGENKKMIVNSFCQTMHLLNFLRKHSGCGRCEQLDLISWRAGELQNLSGLRFDYAYRFLRPRETYLLVKIIDTVGDKNKTLPQYISLLDNLEQLSPELAGRLEQLSKPGKSLGLKTKWSNYSKRGMDSTNDKHERKTGLSNILNANKAKSPKDGKLGILGLISAAKEDNSKSDNLDSNSKEKKITKLPPINPH